MVNRDEGRSANSTRSKTNINRSSRQPASSGNCPALAEANSDDVIVSLIDAHENRRARQVNEWEMLRRRSMRFAA